MQGSALVCLVAALLGCDGAAEAVNAEKASLLAHVDKLRDLPVGKRAEALEALGGLQLTDEALSATRDTCWRAYDAHERANTNTKLAASRLAKGAQLDGARALKQAESELATAEAAMPDCDRAVAALRVKK